METQHELTESPSRGANLVFNLKTSVLSFKRSIHNLWYPIPSLLKKNTHALHTLSISESNLWNADDNAQNWILTAGKVENLRLASKRLNGLFVPAGQVFSFWKQLGRPSRSKGYVVGREIREGCVVPTVAGGLCQLSNALYDAALKAGFTILERHRHSKVIKGSLAEQDRDATVKWNYIDLRFKAEQDFCIEIMLTSDQLIVSLKSAQQTKIGTVVSPKEVLTTSILNDCYSCGNISCFKHVSKTDLSPKIATTFLLDEYWSEYERYVKTHKKEHDLLVLPMRKDKFLKVSRYRWDFGVMPSKVAYLTVLWNMLRSRLTKGNVFERSIRNDEALVKAMKKYIPLESTHLVLSQNLLPFLEKEGVLGGRTYDVLMTRLPLQDLHKRLDRAYQLHQESSTLTDFRVSEKLMYLENKALKHARKIITPHRQIASLFQNKAVQLSWDAPRAQDVKTQHNTLKILFPASALARKGAYEVRLLAMDLGLQVVVLGNAREHINFWDGVSVEKAGENPFEGVSLVVYPTFVEHQPRFLLKAIAARMPLITTEACGLPENECVTLIPVGDYPKLKAAVEDKLASLYKVDALIP